MSTKSLYDNRDKIPKLVSRVFSNGIDRLKRNENLEDSQKVPALGIAISLSTSDEKAFLLERVIFRGFQFDRHSPSIAIETFLSSKRQRRANTVQIDKSTLRLSCEYTSISGAFHKNSRGVMYMPIFVVRQLTDIMK